MPPFSSHVDLDAITEQLTHHDSINLCDLPLPRAVCRIAGLRGLRSRDRRALTSIPYTNDVMGDSVLPYAHAQEQMKL